MLLISEKLSTDSRRMPQNGVPQFVNFCRCTPCRQRRFAQMLAHDAPHICCFPCRKNKKTCRTLRSGRFPAGLASPRRKIRPARREKLRPVSLYQPRGVCARKTGVDLPKHACNFSEIPLKYRQPIKLRWAKIKQKRNGA